MDYERCHVTIVGTRRRVDLAVPAHAAIAEYTPTLLKLCGQEEVDDTFPAAWSLALPGERPFAPEASLGASGVADGAMLYLRDSAAGEFEAPVVTDLEELVEEANRAGIPWDARRRASTMTVSGILCLIAALAVLIGSRSAQPLGGVCPLVAGLGLALLGWHATRRHWSLPLGVRLITVLSAVPLLALAAASLPVAGNGVQPTLVAVSLGAVVGALAARMAVRHVTTLTALTITMLAVPVTIVLAALNATLAQSAGVVAVVVLGVLGAAPTASGHLAAMAPAADGATLPTEAEIPWLVGQGRRVLIGLNILCSVLLAACLVVLGSADEPFAIALAACMGLALILRSGQLKAFAAVLPVISAGVVGLTTVLLHAPGYFGAQRWVGPVALLAAGLIAWAVGMVRAFSPLDAEAERAPWIGVLAWVLSLLSVPLAVGIFGLFDYLLHLGESL